MCMASRQAHWGTPEKISVRVKENKAQNKTMEVWFSSGEGFWEKQGSGFFSKKWPFVEVVGCNPVNDKWWQSSAYLIVPLNSLPMEKLKCHSVYGRGQSWNKDKSNRAGQVQTWLLGLIIVQNQSSGTSWLLTPLHGSWSALHFPVSFKIKPTRQFPGVQGRSQNAEQM